MRYVLLLLALAISVPFLLAARSSGQQPVPIEVATAQVVLAVRDAPMNELSITDGVDRFFAFATNCEGVTSCDGPILYVMVGPVGVEDDPLATGKGTVYIDLDLDGTLDYVSIDGSSLLLLPENHQEQYAQTVATLAVRLSASE